MFSVITRPDRLELLTREQVLQIIENNRTRIRNLCHMIIITCGILFSTSFSALLFLLKDQKNIPHSCLILLCYGEICILFSLATAVASILIPKPANMLTMFDYVNHAVAVLNMEYGIIKVAIYLLFIAIILLYSTIVALLWQFVG